ncbi:hypothetical protein E4U55_005450 [Claviceps digitariae]|nr:hypothetical protein E4U55_005450 [Claviceps digitariae]
MSVTQLRKILGLLVKQNGQLSEVKVKLKLKLELELEVKLEPEPELKLKLSLLHALASSWTLDERRRHRAERRSLEDWRHWHWLETLAGDAGYLLAAGRWWHQVCPPCVRRVCISDITPQTTNVTATVHNASSSSSASAGSEWLGDENCVQDSEHGVLIHLETLDPTTKAVSE